MRIDSQIDYYIIYDFLDDYNIKETNITIWIVVSTFSFNTLFNTYFFICRNLCGTHHFICVKISNAGPALAIGRECVSLGPKEKIIGRRCI